ncbi:hypothetical protein [Edaphobacter dinghuensis]|uniref:Uncharacterized protein n=1 Tax=Edaphobacter dinghuensis TaxID=1560005 RepID=A0A917HEH9_9BACT|nr:hypothetical protein [Edaphobacter dinghuensis]GGG77280.1 hypothetical protein GCM10011585_20460 [Edaphobacter dinghuensis]
MHAPTLHSTYDNAAAPTRRVMAADFLLTHPLLPVLRGVFISSLLWIFLALVLYGVYTLIVAH